MSSQLQQRVSDNRAFLSDKLNLHNTFIPQWLNYWADITGGSEFRLSQKWHGKRKILLVILPVSLMNISCDCSLICTLYSNASKIRSSIASTGQCSATWCTQLTMNSHVFITFFHYGEVVPKLPFVKCCLFLLWLHPNCNHQTIVASLPLLSKETV